MNFFLKIIKHFINNLCISKKAETIRKHIYSKKLTFSAQKCNLGVTLKEKHFFDKILYIPTLAFILVDKFKILNNSEKNLTNPVNFSNLFLHIQLDISGVRWPIWKCRSIFERALYTGFRNVKYKYLSVT